MKTTFFTLFLSLFSCVYWLSAADTDTVTYEGKITGVVCVSCKAHVSGALTQNLPSVVKVDVKAGENPEEQKLVIVAKDGSITKESATAALGTYAKNYTILSLAKK